jgi:hypothetical protein
MTETFSLKIPAVFGDHHTSEIRRILSEFKGVEKCDVSSAFNEVWIEIDPSATKRETIEDQLRQHGYISGDETPMYPSDQTPSTTKHTEVQSDVIAFYDAEPSWEGRPLWPCPGLDYQPAIDEE